MLVPLQRGAAVRAWEPGPGAGNTALLCAAAVCAWGALHGAAAGCWCCWRVPLLCALESLGAGAAAVLPSVVSVVENEGTLPNSEFKCRGESR